MTQKEIDKFLANTKVYVKGKSREIQEKLFSFGYLWSINCQEVKYEEKPFLMIYDNKTITYTASMKWFSNHINKEISADSILALELTKSSYRPFKDAEECWQEMLKHQPFGWLKYKENTIYTILTYIEDNSEDVERIARIGNLYWSLSDSFENYTFADGTPFGIKED